MTHLSEGARTPNPASPSSETGRFLPRPHTPFTDRRNFANSFKSLRFPLLNTLQLPLPGHTGMLASHTDVEKEACL